MYMERCFAHLTPEIIISSVEKALGQRMTGFTMPLPSYINRVYELQAFSGERIIAKFYRPNRWSLEAIEEEHLFIRDCILEEIPVVQPLALKDGSTIASVQGTFFSLFPKKAGRVFEATTDEDWVRMGAILGRIHLAGSRRDAPSRITMHPGRSTKDDLSYLVHGGFVAGQHASEFEDLCMSIIEDISPLFEDVPLIRIHGDFHRGNLLDRPGEGLMVIDFDDMMMGPPVHDMWMLLPERAHKSLKEIELILKGYESFFGFDRSALRLIEALRFMRIIYYLAWCARQHDDYDFRSNHPDWGSEAFWHREIIDLRHQRQVIMEHLRAWDEGTFFEEQTL